MTNISSAVDNFPATYIIYELTTGSPSIDPVQEAAHPTRVSGQRQGTPGPMTPITNLGRHPLGQSPTANPNGKNNNVESRGLLTISQLFASRGVRQIFEDLLKGVKTLTVVSGG